MSLQRDVDRDQNNHVDNMHDDKMDHKIGRDFRSLGHHPGMVHLHSGMEHLTNVDVEVNILLLYIVLISFKCLSLLTRYFYIFL